MYCFYHDVSLHREDISKGIMKKEIVDILIEKALNDAHEITFAFQGGEPTLAKIEYFQYFVEMINQKKDQHIIHYAIQTNGMMIDEQWVRFFKKHHFLVGLSIDGYQSNHDAMRLKAYQPTHAHLMHVLQLLNEYHIDYNILTVITKQFSYHAKELYQFYKKYHIKYVQLIPCLPELDCTYDEYSLTPQNFYQFYHDFFELWYHDLCQKEYMSVSLFEDLLMIFSGKTPRTCGMLGQCQVQMIIEADGSVYPCDFYALDEYMLGNIAVDSIENILRSHHISSFLNHKKRTSFLCKQCRFKNVCHGNCHRMNVVYFDNQYCGYQQFLEETYQIFYQIAREM